MREIEFRGKRVDNGEWVYGDLIQLSGRTFISTRKVFSLAGSGYHFDLESWCLNKNLFEVIPETIGQYTGLKDKNSKKIFEGDKALSSNGTIYTIMFDPIGCWCLDGNGALNSEILGENNEDIEVIGTIFDKECNDESI